MSRTQPATLEDLHLRQTLPLAMADLRTRPRRSHPISLLPREGKYAGEAAHIMAGSTEAGARGAWQTTIFQCPLISNEKE